MRTMIKPAPVRKSVTVEVPLDKAFDVFTGAYAAKAKRYAA
ncbi:hypothetical protein [Mesorhizobium sp. M0199]